MVIKTPIIGVDLGQSADYTAISYGVYGGEKQIVPLSETDENSQPVEKPVRMEPVIHIRYLERLQLGTPYETQVDRLRKIYDRVKTDTGKVPMLIVDGTGVGRAVVEMIQKAGMHPIVVTVTGGNTVTKTGRDWHVPKKELVSPAIVGIQNGTVQIARSLEHAELLKKEMQDFKLKINIATGNESFEAWRESTHDDLVFSVSLVVYAFRTSTEPGVCARTIIPSKYNEGRTPWNKYR